MTREEARQWFLKVYSEIKGKGYADENEEAYELAIKALEQEPTSEMVHVETLHQVMWERDIAIEQLHELGYEFGQKIEPCDDVVSRQAVIDAIDKWVKNMHILVVLHTNEVTPLFDSIHKLPSVRPQEQTGKCITCKYGEIYNDLWCKCHDPLLDGIMVKMTDQCRSEEIIELNCKFKAERKERGEQ